MNAGEQVLMDMVPEHLLALARSEEDEVEGLPGYAEVVAANGPGTVAGWVIFSAAEVARERGLIEPEERDWIIW